MSTTKILCFVGLLASVSGCGPMTVGDYPVHSAGMARPTSMDRFPHTTFKDRDAYLVGSDWFYLDPTYGWVVFDLEPKELRAYRERTLALDTRGLR
jgi:hypothetical protein